MTEEFTFRTATISNADGPDVRVEDQDHGVRANADTEVIFRNLETRLVDQINQAEGVFGCVAWLTSVPILNALASKKAVGIVVQKEDFLRPDSGDWWQERQRQAYEKIPGFNRYRVGQTGMYDYASVADSPAIRCVGVHNAAKKSAYPRMHNKFLVFCKSYPLEEQMGGDHYFSPYAAWTGSFNLTYNASNSLENAVLIRSEKVAEAFMHEFGTIFGLSEKLDWAHPWSAPEHRIGS
jgi:phosphatidylserine/phosphatidylglycerophosphate/cardiolipin synthase-like enzyme